MGWDPKPVKRRRRRPPPDYAFSDDSWDPIAVRKLPRRTEARRTKAAPKPPKSDKGSSSGPSACGSSSSSARSNTSSSASASRARSSSEDSSGRKGSASVEAPLVVAPPAALAAPPAVAPPADLPVAAAAAATDDESDNVSIVSIASSYRSTRTVGTSTPFGLCRLTPRFGAVHSDHAGRLLGYQATCMNPHHTACNRSLSNNVSGSEEMTLRMLQLWLALGVPVAVKDKSQHKQQWTQVEWAAAAGTLPTLAQLEAIAPTAYEPHMPAQMPPPPLPPPLEPPPLQDPPSSSASASAGPPTADAATAPAPGTPRAVQLRMQELIDSGALASTTVEQRRRNKRTMGTTYGAPPHLQEAVEHSYCLPDLPPPPGMKWKRKAANKFMLVPRGG